MKDNNSGTVTISIDRFKHLEHTELDLKKYEKIENLDKEIEAREKALEENKIMVVHHYSSTPTLCFDISEKYITKDEALKKLSKNAEQDNIHLYSIKVKEALKKITIKQFKKWKKESEYTPCFQSLFDRKDILTELTGE